MGIEWYWAVEDTSDDIGMYPFRGPVGSAVDAWAASRSEAEPMAESGTPTLTVLARIENKNTLEFWRYERTWDGWVTDSTGPDDPLDPIYEQEGLVL